MQELWGAVEWLLGLQANSFELMWWQIMLRAMIVYVIALILVRLGDRRFIGKLSAFDVVLGIILGSVLSRAITGSAPFFPTIGAGLALIGMHRLFATVAFHFRPFSILVKGSKQPLIVDGEIQWDNMRASSIGEHDLHAALRAEASIDDPAQVEAAYLERSGDISVIPREQNPPQ